MGVGLVEEVAAVLAHRQVQRAVDGAQEAREGGPGVGQVDDPEAGLVEAAGEAADGDGLAGPARPGHQRHASHVGPERQAEEELALGAGVEHLVVAHGLAEGQPDEGEVALQADLDGFGQGLGAHGRLAWS